MEELLHRSLSHNLQGFYTSLVVQDFFHERYEEDVWLHHLMWVQQANHSLPVSYLR